ncbi:MAG TPA: EF-hand domain-containing protein [Lentisphaeria bacterium]|nr:hypothetical protein [Lentisphaerota bacterium]OQC12543.1 MAG: transaldolase/EF-hand domain-containing protein [Lentisphaerae bacterium ADurb.Bin082]HPY90813.1 EF-hand domain-containing protein [Lentisphaeria bacterium]
MKKLLAALAILALGSLVVAQEAPAADAPEANAPAAAEEKVSEADAAWQAALKAIDQDGDGKCTPAECNDFVEKTEIALAELRRQNTLARIVRLDQNQDGAVSKDELPESNDQVSMLFNRMDVNKDGKLDQDEMKAIFAAAGNRPRGERRQRGPEARERRGPEARERRGQAGERREGQAPGAGLARFDKNQDGVVTRDELPADRPRMAEMFDRLDANKDGKLDQDELKGGRAPGNRGGERRRHQAEGEPAGIKAD